LCVKEIFHTISGVWVGGLFSGGPEKFGDRRGEGRFQTFGKGFLAVLRLLRVHQFLPPPDGPSLPTTEGMPPRSNQGPDEGDPCSGEVARIDPGRIQLALSRPGSEPVAHGLWERVLI
jgi:hypothetical protein